MLESTRRKDSYGPDDEPTCDCGDEPDGFDAHRHAPTCERCAAIRTDGGLPTREERELAAVRANQRQAAALEVIAGMLMLQFDYDDDRPGYTVESLYQEARYYGRGGERR